MRKAFVLAALLLVVGAPAAVAHVAVEPKEAAKGATATFTFTVPNEEAPAATNAVEIVWPDDVTFTTVSPAAKSGWTAMPSDRSVKWSGGSITGENKEPFTVTVGPLPNTATITFKALQTYDNGNVARWIGAAATDNPAPVVTLTGAPVTTTTEVTIGRAPTTLAARPVEEKGEKSNAATFLIAGAMLLAGVGVGVAVAARRRAPKP